MNGNLAKCIYLKTPLTEAPTFRLREKQEERGVQVHYEKSFLTQKTENRPVFSREEK